VCEVLARRLGRLERMQHFESLTTDAEIASARAEMSEWYAATSRAELVALLDDARWAPGAREAVALPLRAEGYVCAISSVTWRFAVARFADWLGIEHYQGTDLTADGSIEHVGPEDKLSWVSALAARLGSCRPS
jgi:phosphoserine phosphatase